MIFTAEDYQWWVFFGTSGLMMAVTASHFSIFPSDPLQNPERKAGQPLMLPPLPVKQ